MRCHIRSAKIRDLPQLADVLAGSFYPPLGWRRCFYPLLRFSIYEDLKQRLQAAQKHYRCLAAIASCQTHLDDLVVGTVEMSCRRYSWYAFNHPQQIYLSNLAVREDYRRRGVARQLLQSAEHKAIDWGFREIYLHVMADNSRACHLYEQMGYRLQHAEVTLLSLLNVQPPRLLLKKTLSHTRAAHSGNSQSHPTSLGMPT
ncbi:MAG: GNAT family N-acetyltransferase [Leptolyngbyaceae cyanobacterium]